jgi:sulfotransferase family protein
VAQPPAARSNRLSGIGYLLSPAGGTSGSRLRDVTIKAIRLYRRDRWRYSHRRRRRAVDRIPLDRPIFFLGVQGGGETIIGRCVRRNSAVVSMSGNSGYWTGIDELGAVRNRMGHLPTSLRGCKYRDDLAHPLFGSNHNSVYACDELLQFYRRTAADASDDDAAQLRRVLREHIAVYARDPKHARFFDKTHTNTLKLPLLAAYLSGCDPLFVLVTRNPYSWCYRAVRRKRPSYRVRLAPEQELRLAAEHWVNSYRIALADAETIPNVTVVRFEDFVADPEATVRRLCAALGLELQASMIPRPGDAFPFATLPADRKWYPLFPDEWLAEVSDREAAVVAEVCEPLATELGYGWAASSTTSTLAAAAGA